MAAYGTTVCRVAPELVLVSRMYPIAQQAVSSIVATVTLIVLLVGYGLARCSAPTGLAKYVETTLLSTSAFLLMVPTISESLRRLPVDDPFAKGLQDPVLLGAQSGLLLALIVGIPFQLRALYKRNAIQAKK